MPLEFLLTVTLFRLRYLLYFLKALVTVILMNMSVLDYLPMPPPVEFNVTLISYVRSFQCSRYSEVGGQ
jgi:hypothetical protein